MRMNRQRENRRASHSLCFRDYAERNGGSRECAVPASQADDEHHACLPKGGDFLPDRVVVRM